MKTKLNLTIDEELVSCSKEYARIKGVSVSQLVEKLFRKLTGKGEISFSEKWRGKFYVAEKSDPKYEKLKKRYDLFRIREK